MIYLLFQSDEHYPVEGLSDLVAISIEEEYILEWFNKLTDERFSDSFSNVSLYSIDGCHIRIYDATMGIWLDSPITREMKFWKGGLKPE